MLPTIRPAGGGRAVAADDQHAVGGLAPDEVHHRGQRLGPLQRHQPADVQDNSPAFELEPVGQGGQLGFTGAAAETLDVDAVVEHDQRTRHHRGVLVGDGLGHRDGPRHTAAVGEAKCIDASAPGTRLESQWAKTRGCG